MFIFHVFPNVVKLNPYGRIYAPDFFMSSVITY